MKNLYLILVWFAFSSSLNSANAQTGPGGIGAASSNPLWYDASALNLADGSAVSSWTDMSGNSSDALQANSSKRPIYNQVAVNGKASVSFNGSNQHLITGANASLNNPNILRYYVVAEVDNFSGNRIPFNLDYGSASRDLAWTGLIAQVGNLYAYGRSYNYLEKAVISPSAGFNIYGANYTNSTNTLFSNLNFATGQTITTATYHPSTSHENTWIGGGPTQYYFDGSIAEVFAFNFVLNAAQEKILQNYISAKYGISISSDMYSFESTHGYGVIGIGQETAGALHSDSKGWDILQINTPGNLEDGEYLFAGHSGTALSTFSSNVPDLLPNGGRFERTWRVEKTGDLGTVTVVFHLDASTDFSSDPNSYRLIIDGDGDFDGVVDQILTGSYDAFAQTVTFTNVNFGTGDFFTLAGDPADIHSIATGNWSDPSTWDCSCIPSFVNNVFIDPTHSVEVDVDATARSLTIESTATLTMNNTVDLEVYADLTNNGTFAANAGQLSFTGDVAQLFTSNAGLVTLNNIRINNSDPGGVTLESGQYLLNGTLTMETGLLTISATGTSFIVNSTTTGTEGRIAAIPAGSSISGSVSVRRFIPSGLADWRDICSPVTGATFEDWDPDLSMSGDNFPDGCASSGSDPCYESVKYTLNSIETGVLNVTDPITNGQGYYVFMGDDLSTFSGTTLTSTGTVNGSSDIVEGYGSGWQTIGNPYVSPMLFSSTTRTSQIGNYFYVYDASIGEYQWYDGASGLGSIPELDNGLMAIGQGVWIFTSSAGGSITYHQTDKTSANATYIRSQELETADNNLYLKLREHNSTFESSVMLSLSDNADDGFDEFMDMQLLENGLEAASRLSIVNDDAVLKKNFIRNDVRNKAFNLNTNIKRAGYYSLELSNFESFMGYRQILLYDAETNEFIDLKRELTYTFYSDIFEGNRFTLILTNEETSEASTVQSLTVNETVVTEESLTITQMGHTFNVVVNGDLTNDSQVRLVNVLGQTEVYSTNIQLVEGSNLITVPSELHGVHILIITTGDKMVTKKVVL